MMEPISTVAAIIALVDWRKALSSLATDAARGGAKGLLNRFKPDEREIAAKYIIERFAEQFLKELEDATPLSSAIPGYQDDLKRLLEIAAPEITAWLQPETREVDLAAVERTWRELGLDPLPECFDWALVAKNFARDIRAYVRNDATLREKLNTALLEQQTAFQRESAATLARLAGPDPGFDLAGYRDYLSQKCALLPLSALDTSTYDRDVQLWSVFVPQSARLSVPVRNLPREILRRPRDEKHLSSEPDQTEIDRLREAWQNIAPVPILDVLDRHRLVVILGDPGSGKTSLLKYMALRWINAGTPPFPIWIDLKDYAQERRGFLEYCESACTTYRLDARALERSLGSPDTAVYLDGLDEIFDGPARGKVMEEIAAFAARYSNARLVVTSHIIGYEPDRLRNCGFTHATLEEFDDQQVREFLVKWHEAAVDEPKERARLQGQLESALQESGAVRELAGNPLLLTVIAILNRTQPLPRNRVELYEQASRVLLHEWDASRSLPVDTFARQEKEGLLRELAGAMQKGDGSLAGNIIGRDSLIQIFRKFLQDLGLPDPHTKAISLVNQLTERNFILCYAGANYYSFVHRTFLEYFCAAWFVDLFEKKQTITLEQLKTDVFGQRWKDETWHEVLRLIAGLVGEKKSEELIKFLLEQDGREAKLANLMLAAECLGELRNRRAIQETDESVKARLLEQAIRYSPPDHYEPIAEYPECGPTRTRAVVLLARLWRDDATRQWLVSAAGHDRDWIVRAAAVLELARGWSDDPETLPIIRDRARSDEHYVVRGTALHYLAWSRKAEPETLPILKDRAQSDRIWMVRLEAVLALARDWKEYPGTLPILKDRARSDEYFAVRRAAVEALERGWKEDPEVQSLLEQIRQSNGPPQNS